MNLEGGQLFCLTEVKGPHEWPGYCHQHLFSLDIVAVLMLIHTCRALSGVIVDTKQDEDKSNFPDLSMHMLLNFEIMMIFYIFPWSTLHVMNAYVDNICIFEDDNNIPKENLSPPLIIPYPKIYLIVVPGLISYANTSHFIIVFFGAVHA